jgi:hypothetical protein
MYSAYTSSGRSINQLTNNPFISSSSAKPCHANKLTAFEKAVAEGDGIPIDDNLQYNASIDLNNDEDSI